MAEHTTHCVKRDAFIDGLLSIGPTAGPAIEFDTSILPDELAQVGKSLLRIASIAFDIPKRGEEEVVRRRLLRYGLGPSPEVSLQERKPVWMNGRITRFDGRVDKAVLDRRRRLSPLL